MFFLRKTYIWTPEVKWPDQRCSARTTSGAPFTSGVIVSYTLLSHFIPRGGVGRSIRAPPGPGVFQLISGVSPWLQRFLGPKKSESVAGSSSRMRQKVSHRHHHRPLPKLQHCSSRQSRHEIALRGRTAQQEEGAPWTAGAVPTAHSNFIDFVRPKIDVRDVLASDVRDVLARSTLFLS